MAGVLRVVLLLHPVLTWLLGGELVAAEEREYCEAEYFNVTCPRNQVILIHSALYGRMKAGRCISNGYGHMGCSEDVIDYIDRRCSGRPHCQVYVAEPVLHRRDPCPKELASYLEADYSCISATTAQAEECQRRRSVVMELGTPPPASGGGGGGGGDASPPASAGSATPTATAPLVGYLTSDEGISRGVGTASCPWLLRAAPGQRLSLKLLNFGGGRAESAGQAGSSSSFHSLCYEIGTIFDGPDDVTITSCGGSRETAIYTSKKNEVKVELRSEGVLKTLTPFLIKYEAFGCRTIPAPPGGSVEIQGEVATVRCNKTEETWYLTCAGTTWMGKYGNCSAAAGHEAHGQWSMGKPFLESDGDFPYGILIVVAIGVALGVFFGGIILSVVAVYMKRKHKRYETPAELRSDLEADYYQDSTIKTHHGYSPDVASLSPQQQQQQQQVSRQGAVPFSERDQMCQAHKDLGFYSTGKTAGVGGGGGVGARGLYNTCSATGQRTAHFYESPQVS